MPGPTDPATTPPRSCFTCRLTTLRTIWQGGVGRVEYFVCAWGGREIRRDYVCEKWERLVGSDDE